MQKKHKTLFVLGILVVIVPLLGVPSSWKSFVLTIIGIAIIWMTLVLHKESGGGAIFRMVRRSKKEIVAPALAETEGIKIEETEESISNEEEQQSEETTQGEGE